jgi:hypothetical protein
MVIPCFSFAGLCIDGEDRSQVSMEKDFMDWWPLERVAIMGAVAWGPMRGWLPKIHFAEGVKRDRPTRTMLAVLKLFDMWVWHAHCNAAIVRRLERIEEECGIGKDGTRFLGYWENGDVIRHSMPGVKASGYFRKGETALVYVSNFAREDVTVPIAFGAAGIGFPGLSVTDAESGAVIPEKGGHWYVSIPWHDFRALRLSPGQGG